MNTTATMESTISRQDWSQYLGKNWEKKEGNGSSAEVEKGSKPIVFGPIILKGGLNAQKQEKYIEAYTELDRFSEELRHWVDSVSLPEKWISEGIHPPTVECKNLAKSVILKFYKDFSMYPISISATIEEGIFIKYINHINKLELSLEIYNDMDIAAIITKGKKIIFSRDIPYISDEYFSEIFGIFYEK